MGYRSNVYLKANIELIDDFQSKFTSDTHYWDTFSSGSNYFYVFWDDTKWYSSFPEVQDICGWVSDNSDNCGMIEIGEDNATEIWGNPYDVGMYETVVISGFEE
jgi:hypothetical protein